MSVQIRPFENADTAAVVALVVAAFQAPQMAGPMGASFYAALTLPKQHVALVAEDTQTQAIAGYILCRSAADEAEIISIAVTQSHRRQGLAKQLLEQALLQLKALEVNKLFLEVRLSNLAAQRLYQSFGAQQVGYRKNYYTEADDGKAEDALVLALTF